VRVALHLAVVLGLVKCSMGLVLAMLGRVEEESVPAWVSLIIVGFMCCGVSATLERHLEIAVTFSLIGAMYAERFWAAQGWFFPVEILLVPSLYLIAYKYPTTLLNDAFFPLPAWAYNSLWAFLSIGTISLFVGILDPHFDKYWGFLGALALIPIVVLIYRTYGVLKLYSVGLILGLLLPALFLAFASLSDAVTDTMTASTVALWFCIAPIAAIIHYWRTSHDI